MPLASDRRPPILSSSGGGSGSATPSGPAGGDLSGTYPNPSVVNDSHDHTGATLSAITDTSIAAANKDGAAGTPSMRTLGTTALSACAGNDSRLSDSRAPTGAAGGDLSGTYPNPDVVGLTFTDGSLLLGTQPTSSARMLALSGGAVAGVAGIPAPMRTTSAATDTLTAADTDGTVVYGANCTSTITAGLSTGTRILIAASAIVVLTWSVSGGESISEASTALGTSESVWLVKESATAWRVLQGSVVSGWRLVRSLSFNGVTPALSMSVPDSITGSSYTATLTTTTGWTSAGGGIRYQPATAGCDLDIDLDALLGSTWQSAGVLILWDMSITLVGTAVVVTALVAAATAVYMVLDPGAWTVWVGGASGPSAAVAASSQRVQGHQVQATGCVFYRAETAAAAPSALTTLAQASYQRLSATVPLTGLKTRIGLNEPGGSTLDVTITGVRVYARCGL